MPEIEVKSLVDAGEIIGNTGQLMTVKLNNNILFADPNGTQIRKRYKKYIVKDFPNRIDQWCVYVDMVIKNGEHDTGREIFERMIQLGLAPKKMKSLFKKYWEFEQANGDQGKVDAVRKKALEYLEKQNVEVNDDDDPLEQMDTC